MRVDVSYTKKKDNWKVLCSMVTKVFRLHGEEINLKVESSFSLNMTKKKQTFEHNNSRDNILYITVTVTLTPLYNDNLPSLISTKTSLLKTVPSTY